MQIERDELSLFSYEILGLIGRGGAGPYDLRRMADQGRILAWAGESQYYTEPKRLARLGYLTASKVPGRTRERTVYALTEKGFDALSAWARAPARLTPLKSEPLVRLLIANLVGDDVTRESFAALRVEIADLRSRLAEIEAVAETLPERREYMLLATRFLHRFLDLHEELVAEFGTR